LCPRYEPILSKVEGIEWVKIGKMSKINLNFYSGKAYENTHNWTLSENKPNQSIKYFENSPFWYRLVDCMKENLFCFTGRDYV
jgi:hypothetical protein